MEPTGSDTPTTTTTVTVTETTPVTETTAGGGAAATPTTMAPLLLSKLPSLPMAAESGEERVNGFAETVRTLPEERSDETATAAATAAGDVVMTHDKELEVDHNAAQSDKETPQGHSEGEKVNGKTPYAQAEHEVKLQNAVYKETAETPVRVDDKSLSGKRDKGVFAFHFQSPHLSLTLTHSIPI